MQVVGGSEDCGELTEDFCQGHWQDDAPSRKCLMESWLVSDLGDLVVRVPVSGALGQCVCERERERERSVGECILKPQ